MRNIRSRAIAAFGAVALGTFGIGAAKADGIPVPAYPQPPAVENELPPPDQAYPYPPRVYVAPPAEYVVPPPVGYYGYAPPVILPGPVFRRHVYGPVYRPPFYGVRGYAPFHARAAFGPRRGYGHGR